MRGAGHGSVLLRWQNRDDGRGVVPDDLSPDVLAAREFCFESPLVPPSPGVEEYASNSFPVGRRLVDAIADLTGRIFAEFAYDPGFTTVTTPLEEVLRCRRGVCQDFAHLAIGCLRSMGLAARYVSGYLETSPPEGEDRLVGADASHAWPSVFVPDWTQVIDGNLLKTLSWYDNEWGYSCRTVDLIRMVGKLL